MTEEDAQEIGESVARSTYKLFNNLKRLINFIKSKLCNPKKKRKISDILEDEVFEYDPNCHRRHSD
jgi:hypothetical protein